MATGIAGADLVFEKTLTLAEARCGFEFMLTHLDGRELLVTSDEGEIVKPGSFKVIDDEDGMPKLRCADKGRLIVHFDVELPEPGDDLGLGLNNTVRPHDAHTPAPLPHHSRTTPAPLPYCARTNPA